MRNRNTSRKSSSISSSISEALVTVAAASADLHGGVLLDPLLQLCDQVNTEVTQLPLTGARAAGAQAAEEHHHQGGEQHGCGVAFYRAPQ